MKLTRRNAFALFIILAIACVFAGYLAAQPDATAKYPQQVTFTIAQNGTTSAPVNMKGCTMSRIIMPAAWDTANITLLAGEGAGYQPVYDAYGSAVTITAVAGHTISLSPGDYWNWNYLELVATAAQTTGARTLKVVCQNAR